MVKVNIYLQNDVPLCKRRMEKVSARLENFHISNDPGSSLLDIKDRYHFIVIFFLLLSCILMRGFQMLLLSLHANVFCSAPLKFFSA